MKIAQITSVYISVPPKTHGGTERIVYYLCRDLRRRGHHVELFASGDSKVDCTLNAVVPIASQDDPRSTFYLEKEYETRNTWNLYRQGERFDVIHAHWTTIVPYFSDLTTTPTLITYAYIEKEIHEYYKKHFPKCLPVCVSRAQARTLGDESIPVVYNGVDLDEIVKKKIPLRLSTRSSGVDNTTSYTVARILSLHGMSIAKIKSWRGTVSECPRPSSPERIEGIKKGKVNAIFDEGLNTWLDQALDYGFEVLSLEPRVSSSWGRWAIKGR
ncbi:MAG: glycosyltransferase [Deltaproteobacteria bacterium]|nr:glycosyltransferase [Deltaproteobacteria bacterium]